MKKKPSRPISSSSAPETPTPGTPVAPTGASSGGKAGPGASSKTSPRVRKVPARIPSILLEGDKPEAPRRSGPGERYALGPTTPAEQFEERELPEAYGTRQLLLAARDPHWVYAHWDLTREQQRQYNSLSKDRHLILRIHVDSVSSPVLDEIHVHPESRHWFVHVVRAGTRYVAELGYYRAPGQWVTISASAPTLTPSDAVSADTSAEFATIPFEVPMAKLLSLVKEAVQENVPLAEALQELRSEGHPGLPPAVPPQAWTPAQEQALARVVSMDDVRRVWMGSLEITELIRRQIVQDMASMAAAQRGVGIEGGGVEAPPTSPGGAPGGITSPGAGGQRGPKGFWFNVNAELIVYGATEPDARVTIGGRVIRLRPDGSFSYRFVLPDGRYELPIVAVSSDQTDGRAAELRFSRTTEYRGEVGEHPQDPALPRIETAGS